MVRIFVLAIMTLALFVGNMTANEYKIAPKASSLKWLGEKVGKNHYGTVGIKDGSMTKSGNNYSGTFTIDMTTIKVDDIKDAGMNGKLLGHLQSDDFFSVQNHKTATFKLKSIKDYKPKKDEKGNHWVTGDLTIKGITHEIGFPAEIKFDGNGFKADAKFSINRAKWEIKYGSGSFFDNLGDAMISDDIKYELKLVGKVK